MQGICVGPALILCQFAWCFLSMNVSCKSRLCERRHSKVQCVAGIQSWSKAEQQKAALWVHVTIAWPSAACNRRSCSLSSLFILSVWHGGQTLQQQLLLFTVFDVTQKVRAKFTVNTGVLLQTAVSPVMQPDTHIHAAQERAGDMSWILCPDAQMHQVL